MPSFDVSSEMNWQELDNAINQAGKEASQRYDFKGIKVELKLDTKARTVTLWCSDEDKLDALNDIFQNKAIKRGVSLLSFDYGAREAAFGGSVRQVVTVQAGISKEKAKELISVIKESKLRVNCQIQDEQLRVSGKSRDELQAVIAVLKQHQDQLKIPMLFGNFRD
jgi:uncharacterized protein YajQ (UPF0234 family)